MANSITTKGKKKHGGKRSGAGRPKLKDSEKKDTKVIRVPTDKIKEIKKLLENES